MEDRGMTKADKMRALIRQELQRSFIPGLERGLKSHAPFVRKLKQYPDFIPAVIEEFVELQLPFYMMAEDHVAEKAYEFFTSEDGKAWCDLAGKFNDKLMMLVPPFVESIVRRLQALEIN